MNNNVIADKNAEAVVIATLLYHPTWIAHSEYLRAKYFSDTFNACMYWAITELTNKGIENIDALNLENVLMSDNGVKHVISRYNVDISDYILSAQYAAKSTVEEYKLYVTTVIACAYRRSMDRLSREINGKCFDDKINISDLAKFAREGFNDLSEKFILTDEIVPFGEKVLDLWKNIKESYNGTGIAGFPSKLSILNKYTSFQKGELVLLYARMKRGKSAYFMNEAIHKIQNGVATAYLDTEMGDELFLKRMLSCLTGVPFQCISGGKYNTTLDEKKVEDAVIALSKDKSFYHDYIPDTSDDAIIEFYRLAKNKINAEFGIYDYIKDEESIDSSRQYNLLGHKTNLLKNEIAGKMDYAMCAGAQENRNGQIGDSDKIARYVSCVINWRFKTNEELRNDGMDCGNIALEIPANRNGPYTAEGDYLDVRLDGEHMQVYDVEQHKTELPFDDNKEKSDE